jgi:hypothetical protein
VKRPKGFGRVARAVAVRPELWPVALAVAARLAPPRWWCRWPPSPWPDADYWRFRMETAYGGNGDEPPDPGDVVEFLEWCRDRWRRPARALR